MKKHLAVAAKTVCFFVLWALSLLPITVFENDEPGFINGNAALLRLWWELIPMLGILLATGVFIWILEKGRIRVPILKNPIKNIISGAILGGIWIGGTILTLFLVGSLSLGEKNDIPQLSIWFLAVLLNVIMQEYLVRGYLFSLYRKKYGIIAATVVTTALFTAMHGGAFEAGLIAVLNVITMSVFVSLLLIYTDSLLAPIIVHFIWNGAGRLIFGAVSLADDYPCVWNSVLSGNELISGGTAKIEGSVFVLVINLLLIAFMAYMLKKQKKGETS